jgi:hypothetical protein
MSETGLDASQKLIVAEEMVRVLIRENNDLRATVEAVEKLAADLDEGIAQCEPLSILVSYTRGLRVARDQLVAALSGPLPKETAE